MLFPNIAAKLVPVMHAMPALSTANPTSPLPVWGTVACCLIRFPEQCDGSAGWPPPIPTPVSWSFLPNILLICFNLNNWTWPLSVMKMLLCGWMQSIVLLCPRSTQKVKLFWTISQVLILYVYDFGLEGIAWPSSQPRDSVSMSLLEGEDNLE